MSLETTMRRSLLLAAMFFTAGQASMAFADDDASVATACLRRSDIRTTKILDDRNVLFITRDRTTYNNQLARQCPGMRRNSAMSFTYADNGKLCVGSTFTVLYRTGASTNTTPYTNPLTNEHIALQGPPFVVGPTCQLGDVRPGQRGRGESPDGRYRRAEALAPTRRPGRGEDGGRESRTRRRAARRQVALPRLPPPPHAKKTASLCRLAVVALNSASVLEVHLHADVRTTTENVVVVRARDFRIVVTRHARRRYSAARPSGCRYPYAG